MPTTKLKCLTSTTKICLMILIVLIVHHVFGFREHKRLKNDLSNIDVMGNSATKLDGPYSFESYHMKDGAVKYFLKKNSTGNMTCLEVFGLMKNPDPSLRQFLIDFFRLIKLHGYFWECPPITWNTLNSNIFQFVIVPTHAFKTRKVDSITFNEHFKNMENEYITKFSSLGGDATLISPKPLTNVTLSSYINIASFMREAPDIQIDALWKAIGSAFLDSDILQGDASRKIWLSTSGLGVSWLHVRLDSVPKYYQWREYKEG